LTQKKVSARWRTRLHENFLFSTGWLPA